MIFRTIFAIGKIWQLRTQLKRYRNDDNLQVASILTISAEYLNSQGVKALVLDFDGVLAAHGEPQPRPEVISWLQTMVSDYMPNQIFILSNKPTAIRADYFKQNFPQIVFIVAPRKKPYPDGLLQIQALTGLPTKTIMLVDDRLGTGILAAIIANTQARFMTKPYVNLRFAPFAEIWFILIRGIERGLIALLPG